jgi:transcriptional regulator with XRE-family HTH domain
LLIRATRRTQKLRIDDTAGTAGVGHVFVREVERGKPTVQLGRVMQLLAELGIELKAEVPDAALPEFRRLQSIGLKPLKIRRR